MAHFQVQAGQPLVFDNVVVGPPQSPAFHIMFDLVTTAGEVMTAEDLFSVSVTAALADGDFNNDGSVNAADYVTWRKGIGVAPTPENYNLWRTNFGRTVAGGSGSGLSNSNVPEPSSIRLIFAVALSTLCFARRWDTILSRTP